MDSKLLLASGVVSALWAILEFFGINFARVRSWFGKGTVRDRPPATPREKRLVLAAAGSMLLCVLGLAGVLKAPPAHVDYIDSWGLLNPDTLSIGTNGKYFPGEASRSHLAGVAFHWYADTDRLDVAHLQKSALFDISDDKVSIFIKIDAKFREEVRRGDTITHYYLLLVPHGVTMDQFSTLRQARGLGIRIMQSVAGPP